MTAGNRGWIAVFLCGLALGCGADETPGGGGQMTVGMPTTAGGAGGMGGAAGTQTPSAGTGGLGGALATAGTSGGSAGTSTGGSGGAAGSPRAGTGGMGAAGSTGGAGAGAGGSPGPGPSGPICERWKAATANLSESPWDGDVASCSPGTMTAEALATAHGLHSLYRSMAGLEPVEMTDEGNRLAQECALLMAANNRISHNPDSSWTCYNMERAETAGRSSLSSGGAVGSVTGYMIDPGNPTTLGHRRWILSNQLASVGYGSAGRFSCQYQPAQRAPADAKAWIAWPAPGEIPIQAMRSRFANMDSTGWSVQSDSIDLANADVTVTLDGMDRPVSVTTLGSGYGSRYAISIIPMGWTTAAGQTYNVALSGTSMPIEYEFTIVDCP
jgi:hypothetical protein